MQKVTFDSCTVSTKSQADSTLGDFVFQPRNGIASDVDIIFRSLGLRIVVVNLVFSRKRKCFTKTSFVHVPVTEAILATAGAAMQVNGLECASKTVIAFRSKWQSEYGSPSLRVPVYNV